MMGGRHHLPPIIERLEAPPPGSPSGLMEEGIDSLALVSVLGLTGHSNLGPRTESHWPDLGHMPSSVTQSTATLRGGGEAVRPSWFTCS